MTTLLVRPAPAPPPSRRPALPAWTGLAGAVVLALVLRAPYLRVALGIDEGGDAWVARQWGTGHGSLYGGQWLDRPPLLVALYRAAITAGPLGIRALGAVAAVLVVVGVHRVAGRLGGPRAADAGALLAALLTGSIAIGAPFAQAELLAAAPAVASVGALLDAHRSGRTRSLVLAGALATAALLIKQSAVDAAVAGAAFLLVRALVGGPGRLRAVAAYAGGVLLALLPVAAWVLLGHVDVRMLLDALVGFRVQSLRTLSASGLPLHVRLEHLALPAAGSGLLVLVPAAAWAVWRRRGDRVVAATLGAWLAGGLAGVLGGGSYWPHYLIELVPVAAVGAALALGAVRRAPRRWVLAGLTALALATSAAGGVAVAAKPPRRADTAVAAWVRGHDRPGDSFEALYARADLNELVGLRTPYPYSWSLMVRAQPDARPRLLHLLRSPQRPTWVVEWQRPSRWHLDPGGAIAAALHRHYRVAARVAGHPILRSIDA